MIWIRVRQDITIFISGTGLTYSCTDLLVLRRWKSVRNLEVLLHEMKWTSVKFIIMTIAGYSDLFVKYMSKEYWRSSFCVSRDGQKGGDKTGWVKRRGEWNRFAFKGYILFAAKNTAGFKHFYIQLCVFINGSDVLVLVFLSEAEQNYWRWWHYDLRP